MKISNTFAPEDHRLQTKVSDFSSIPDEQLTYSFDVAGNLRSIDDSTNLLDESFTYDTQHRVASATGTGTHGYAPSSMSFLYDPAGAGNLVQKGDLALTYGAAYAGAHAVTGATSNSGGLVAYMYDADGNVSGKATADTDEFDLFGHDAENRILLYYYARSTGGSGTATYKYDDSGARVTRSATKTGLPSESVTTIDPEYEVDHNRQPTRVHAYIGATRIATIERAISTGSVGTPPSPVLRELDYHPNHLGTPRLVTDQTGAVIQRTLLKPFGETWKVLDGAGNEFTPSARATAYLFTGQHADVETGLHYFGARHYDPLIGRFLEVDPELVGPTAGVTFERIGGAAQNLNAYGYALNNPTRYVDPSGRWWETPLDLIGLSLSVNDYYQEAGF